MKKGEGEVKEDSRTPGVFARGITVYSANVEKDEKSNNYHHTHDCQQPQS